MYFSVLFLYFFDVYTARPFKKSILLLRRLSVCGGLKGGYSLFLRRIREGELPLLFPCVRRAYPLVSVMWESLKGGYFVPCRASEKGAYRIVRVSSKKKGGYIFLFLYGGLERRAYPLVLSPV